MVLRQAKTLRHSFHSRSGPTSPSSIRHGKMPHLVKHPSLAHIICICASQAEESQGFCSRASGIVSTSSPALLWTVCSGGGGRPSHDPFSSPSPPLSMLEKSHSLGFVVVLFSSLLDNSCTSFCQCLLLWAALCPHPQFVCWSPNW